MTLYYVTDKATFEANVDKFHSKLGAHYIDLSNGQILLAANFPESHFEQDAWESISTVELMPNPLFQATAPISDSHQTALADVLAAQAAPAAPAGKQMANMAAPATPAPNNTVTDVAAAVAQINPLMKLRS